MVPLYLLSTGLDLYQKKMGAYDGQGFEISNSCLYPESGKFYQRTGVKIVNNKWTNTE
jgi:hypothetical protein